MAQKEMTRKQDGFAIPFVVLAIVVLFVTGAALLHIGLERQVYSIRTSEDISARCAADAGLERGLHDLNKLFRDNDYRLIRPEDLPSADDAPFNSSDATYSYRFVPSSPATMIIEATGRNHNAERTVKADIGLKNPFSFAVFADEKLTLYNSSIIDWYNYDEGDDPMKVGTNSVRAGAVELKNSIKIKGDVVVGSGGDPASVVSQGANIDIDGTIYAQPRKTQLDPVVVPDWLEMLPSKGNLKSDETLVFPGKYEKIDLGNGEKLTIKGDVRLFVTGDIILGNGAAIEISDSVPNSSLTLYLGGDLECKNSSNINNLTEVPKNFRLLALDSCKEVILKNSTDFYGVVYAPEADIILDNSADLYGSITGKSVDLKNSVDIHYDASLRDLRDTASVLKFVVLRWYEN